MDDTQRGLSHEWKNVQPVVVESTRKLHFAAQHMMSRMDAMERNLNDLIVTVSSLNEDRKAKEERYKADLRVSQQVWGELSDRLDGLRSDFERNAGAHSETVRVLRDMTIPELQHEVDAIKAIHQAQARKEHRIEQLEKDFLGLQRTKVDADLHNDEIRLVNQRMDQLQLFPSFKPGGAATPTNTPSLSLSRWTLWMKYVEANRPLPWHRDFHSGTATAWCEGARHVVKVQEEGIYRLTIAAFHSSRDRCIPSLSIFVNNDPIIHALSSSSTSILRQRQHDDANRVSGSGSCARCRFVRCCCDPQSLNGITVNDMLLLPAKAIITIAYKGDWHYLQDGFLEVQRLA